MESSAANQSAEAKGAGAAHSLAPVEAEGEPCLENLRIDEGEVERLCGLEVHGLWVGSLWAGTYRLGLLKRSPLSLLMTEFLVTALAGMVSLPLGLLLGRNPADAVPDAARVAMPFVITVAVATGALLLLRHGWLARNRRRWRSLLGILDEIDRYHEVLKVLELLDQIQTFAPPDPICPVGPDSAPLNTPTHLADPAPAHPEPAILEALELTRDSLVTGLLADRLLRQQLSLSGRGLRSQRGARSRYADLVDHLDQNLSSLTAFDVGQQLTEEAQLLRDALQISVAVRRSITHKA